MRKYTKRNLSRCRVIYRGGSSRRGRSWGHEARTVRIARMNQKPKPHFILGSWRVLTMVCLTLKNYRVSGFCQIRISPACLRGGSYGHLGRSYDFWKLKTNSRYRESAHNQSHHPKSVWIYVSSGSHLSAMRLPNQRDHYDILDLSFVGSVLTPQLELSVIIQ
jgi:hypothetical protein